MFCVFCRVAERLNFGNVTKIREKKRQEVRSRKFKKMPFSFFSHIAFSSPGCHHTNERTNDTQSTPQRTIQREGQKTVNCSFGIIQSHHQQLNERTNERSVENASTAHIYDTRGFVKKHFPSPITFTNTHTHIYIYTYTYHTSIILPIL